MPTLLQINITANWGSHGKIAEGIGRLAIQHGWQSHIAYGRRKNESQSQLYHIGSMFDEYIHAASSRIFDNQGLMSARATRALIAYIDSIHPDIIQLHNIHGYYLNYQILFKHLKQINIPIVWTLHDCWPFTGHCAHYMSADCEKWKSKCYHCPLKRQYPRSILLDRSEPNYYKKKLSFSSVENMTIVPVSKWLENDVRLSFLNRFCIHQIYNGIDTDVFNIKHNNDVYERYNIPKENKIILGVASNWYHKGLDDFIKLRSLLNEHYSIILVGVDKSDIKLLPFNIIGIKRVEDINELATIYSAADVYFNPTWEDNFPTTNIEAMACGTPVITYDTGGCNEALTLETGCVINKGDLQSAKKSIEEICNKSKSLFVDTCRKRVVENFNMYDKFNEYIDLYDSIINKKRL
jgi:glycosyltransferase involved in cell wall biosynthesis